MINNRIIKGLVGVAVASIGALWSWNFYNKKNKPALPTKAQTLSIVQNIRRQFYPLLIKISDFVTKQLYKQGLDPSQNQKRVLANTEIKQEIQKINQNVYGQFSEQIVREAIQKMYKQDGDIQKHAHEFKQEYKKSLLGIKPQKQMIISRKIGKIQILQVIKQSLQNKCQRIKDSNFMTKTQQERRIWLQIDTQQDTKISKQLLKVKLGLISKDSLQVFQFLINKYKQDGFFKLSYEKIINQYQQKVKSLSGDIFAV